MKKLIKTLFEDEYYCFIILLLWTTTPIVEYYFKNNINSLYTSYYKFIIYAVGILGIVIYSIYLINLKKEKKIQIKMLIPEILLLVLFIISIISSFLSNNTRLSFFGESYRKEGLIVYTMYIGFILLSSMIHNKKYILILTKSIIISALIITILPFFRANFTYYKFSNIFHQFNHYGYYLMINIMLSAFMVIDSKKVLKKIIYLLVNIFFTFLLIRNDTFGSFLAVSITYLFLLIYALIKKYERKNISLLIIVFIITSFLVSYFDIKIGEKVRLDTKRDIVSKNISTFTKDISGILKKDEVSMKKAGTGRGRLWIGAWDYTKKHPFFGGGMECLKKYYKENKIKYSDRPHNIILQVSSFIGIPGAIIYIILITYIAISSLIIIGKETHHIMIFSTAMCYFISSIFGNSMYYTSPYFMILLGLLIGLMRQKKLEEQ